jgi:YD repeat-containing protein
MAPGSVTPGADVRSRTTTFPSGTTARPADGTLDAQNRTFTFGYDRVHNGTTVEDALGQTTVSLYDGMGRLTSVTNVTRATS